VDVVMDAGTEDSAGPVLLGGPGSPEVPGVSVDPILSAKPNELGLPVVS